MSAALLILNGKKADRPEIRQAVNTLRDAKHQLIVNRFSISDVPQVLQEWNNPGAEGKFIQRFKVPWLEGESEHKIPVNLDGEPYAANQIRFSVQASAIKVVLPPDCPCIQ